MQITKNFIQTNLLSSSGKLLSPKLRAHNITLSVEQLYIIYHELASIPLCNTCNNPSTFKNFKDGFRRYCSTKCSANAPSTIQKRHATNMEKYGSTSAIGNELIKEKAKHTSIKKYGVEHAMMSSKIQDKRKATFQQKYGCEFPMQSADLISKIKSTNISKYGTEWANQNSNIQKKAKDERQLKWFTRKMRRLQHIVTPCFDISQYLGVDEYYVWKCSNCITTFESNLSDGRIPRCPTCFPYGYRKSKAGTAIGNFLNTLGVVIESSNRTLIQPYELDIVAPDYKIAIEINGTYWHSELQGRDKHYHLNKMLHCNNAGYRLIQILTTEWEQRPDLVKSRLQGIFGKNNKIGARSCKVELLSPTETAEFLDDNHIQGTCPSSVRLGLVYDNAVVAIMTFGKSRFNKSVEWELLRYSSKKGINVVGGASKLFRYFLNNYIPDSVVSYCDLRWNTGNLYSAIGFTFSHRAPPNCWYTKDYQIFEHRVKFQKHKLTQLLTVVDPSKSAWENLVNNNYDRLWDCGNDVYIWRK